MNEGDILSIMERTAIIAAEAAAKAAVAAVQAMLGVETQAAIETAAAEAARVGAEIGAEASVKAVERERKKFRDARSDRRFRNTKLLLKNYNTLSANCANAVYDAASEATGEDGINEIIEALDELFEEGIQVESIMKSAARTQLIMVSIHGLLRALTKRPSVLRSAFLFQSTGSYEP